MGQFNEVERICRDSNCRLNFTFLFTNSFLPEFQEQFWLSRVALVTKNNSGYQEQLWSSRTVWMSRRVNDYP